MWELLLAMRLNRGEKPPGGAAVGLLRVEEIAEKRDVQAAAATDSDAALATAPPRRPPLRLPWTIGCCRGHGCRRKTLPAPQPLGAEAGA